ncbi:thymidylate synthase [Amycolatopsis lexingtonensis]|uniref:Thymidylate synthase n=1 Tax=Amycolatopsis lexingtonensis TaxID=218822 RepID=A0ABR9IHV0_9PSEU|nr:thymidylate synthase [Amycolatopsis lexingtonensis]MBE1502743.1 thymidylate synthase [Amycolatopsis lexingtonensis]
MLPDQVRITQIGLNPFVQLCDAWLDCLSTVMNHGQDITDDGIGIRELLNVTISGSLSAAEDFIAAGASPARIDLMMRKYHSDTTVPPYTMSYGALFSHHEGINQVAWLVDRLRWKRETKSATIGFHAPGSKELSCISLYDAKIRNEVLHTNVVYRSQNVFASQPGNIVALSSFHRDIAARVDAQVGPITIHILSAHIYHRDFTDVTRILEHQCR